jgi:hypothetical protein
VISSDERINKMLWEWIVAEHHRLHIVEEWPDGPYKEAVLAGIQSTLDSLLLDSRALNHPPCAICQTRRKHAANVDSVHTPRGPLYSESLAA